MCLKVNIGGHGAFICGVRNQAKYCACGRPAEFECDWKVQGNRTCDASICRQHALRVAPGKDLCPVHQKSWEAWQRRHPDFKPEPVQMRLEEK